MTSNHSALNIGVLTYDYDPPIGGLGVLAKTYVTALKSSNPSSRFIIISPSENADEHGSTLAQSRWNRAGGCPLFSLFTHIALPRIIAKHHFDVLHVHAGSGGVFLLKKPSCPVVVTSHHTYHQESTLVFDQSPLKRLWKKFMSLLEQRTYKIADSIVCVSADTRAELIDHYGIDPKKISVIENPVLQTSPSIPLRPFDRLRVNERRGKHCFCRSAGTSPSSRLPTEVLHQQAKAGTEKGLGVEVESNTILFVGRLEERKGIMLLLRAFCTLAKDFPTLKLKLIGRSRSCGQFGVPLFCLRLFGGLVLRLAARTSLKQQNREREKNGESQSS